MKFQSTPLAMMNPRLPPLVYQFYLQGHSIETIENKLAIDHKIFLPDDEIHDIIDQMNELYF